MPGAAAPDCVRGNRVARHAGRQHEARGAEVLIDEVAERDDARRRFYARPRLEIWMEFPAGSLALANSKVPVSWIGPNFNLSASLSFMNCLTFDTPKTTFIAVPLF